MALSPQQTIITVVGSNLHRAAELLPAALEPYPGARIVALTSQSNWATSFGKVTIVAVIEHD
jgi:hypothetical protein